MTRYGVDPALEDRAERDHCGLFDHVSDGDWADPGDLVEPEPFTAPVSLVKLPRLCRRQRPGRRGQTCWGSVVSGRCTYCGAVAR